MKEHMLTPHLAETHRTLTHRAHPAYTAGPSLWHSALQCGTRLPDPSHTLIGRQPLPDTASGHSSALPSPGTPPRLALLLPSTRPTPPDTCMFLALSLAVHSLSASASILYPPSSLPHFPSLRHPSVGVRPRCSTDRPHPQHLPALRARHNVALYRRPARLRHDA